MADVQTSSFLSINWRDAGKAFGIAVLTTFVAAASGTIADWLKTPSFKFDWAALIIPLKTGIYAGIAVLGQRFFSPNKIVVTNASKEDVASIKSGDANIKLESK